MKVVRKSFYTRAISGGEDRWLARKSVQAPSPWNEKGPRLVSPAALQS